MNDNIFSFAEYLVASGLQPINLQSIDLRSDLQPKHLTGNVDPKSRLRLKPSAYLPSAYLPGLQP